MQRVDGGWIYSATDLNNFLECRRLPELDLLVALGKRQKPVVDDPNAELVRAKGMQHERNYLEQLRAVHGDNLKEIPYDRSVSITAYQEAADATIAAMREGRRVIYQATFFDGQFLGFADFLQRVETPSPTLGTDWSYEAVDTKLALSTKPYFIIQLCNYSEHLERVQGVLPQCGAIVQGDGNKISFAITDYYAYYKHIKRRFLEFITGEACHPEVSKDDINEPSVYPLKTEHCSFCIWNEQCTKKRSADDHLSLVAWMRRAQHGKLETAHITKVAELAAAPDSARPREMHPKTFAKLRKQAQLQVESRENGEPVLELLPHDPRTGFGLLPEPATGDVYFDMEGDPLYEPRRGLEYLFGFWLPDDEQQFVALWGCDPAQEKVAFEKFIDFVVERRKLYPKLHVYHYAPYEKTALQRLSQQHSTRAMELDDLLRSEVFVDLYAVVRQSMMIGEESYSIKKLERFYGMTRKTDVKRGDQSVVMFEQWLVTRNEAILNDIENYNKDDCESTYRLHRWLLDRREEAIAGFGDIPYRPLKMPDEPCHVEPFEGCRQCRDREKTRREEERRSDLERLLLSDVIEPQTEDAYYVMGEPMRMRYLLGHLLSYHRREENPVWWEFFRRCENLDELLERDRESLAGLELAEGIAPYKLGPRDRNCVYTYRFSEQQHKMEAGKPACDPLTRESAGEIVEIADDNRLVRVKRAGGIEEARALTALIPGRPIDTSVQRAALVRIAEAYLDGSLRHRYPATWDLLTGQDPRTCHPEVSKDGEPVEPPILQPEHVTAPAVTDVVRALDSSYLFIQGPPGTGKSTIGSEVICDLLKAGKRVCVMSNSHKAAHNLLEKVEACMAKRGERFRGLYKHTNGGSEYVSKLPNPFIESVSNNEDFGSGDYDLAGGTAWLFTRPEITGMFDYLFIDEAGQVSLADALAVSLCAKNVVLLGDPSQLAQVSQGVHAPHCDDSVLQHLLGKDATIPPKRGIFLNRSFRMQPEICRFISETMYDRRLKAGDKTHRHRVDSPGLSGAGLRYTPIEHTGNGAASPEEADLIVEDVSLLRQGTVTDDDGVPRPLEDLDIIIVTPFNAQRRLIQNRLKAAGISVPVGTVDKFQGQQAPVVFYSMATSSGEDIPRDIGFLFEANRLNVAVSRARAMSVLVCSPNLLDVQCRSIEEMALANILCNYAKTAASLCISNFKQDDRLPSRK